MHVTRVTVAMTMTGVAVVVAVLVAVRMGTHRSHSTHSLDASQPLVLIGQFDTHLPGMD